jgi:hypothetical protein
MNLGPVDIQLRVGLELGGALPATEVRFVRGRHRPIVSTYLYSGAKKFKKKDRGLSETGYKRKKKREFTHVRHKRPLKRKLALLSKHREESALSPRVLHAGHLE